MAVCKSSIVVGHIPRKISTACSLFLRKGGLIKCTITGFRQHSSDLVQGGMEVPCQLLFSGEEIDVRKLQRLLPASDSVWTMGQVYRAENGEKEPKRIKLEQEGDDAGTTTTTTKWVKFASYSLSSYDLHILSSGRNLSDQHINYGQELIKKDVGTRIHPRQKRSYMYSYPEADRNGNFVQAMHLPFKNGSGHWILASIVGGQTDEVTVYDSLYNTVNTYTRNLLNRLLKITD